MSKANYEAAKAFRLEHDSFEAAIMAAVMKADSRNRSKLFLAWPEIVEEVDARYDAPGALLEHERVDTGEEGKPKIFVFINGRYGNGDVVSIAIAEDGKILANHLCSSEDFARYDMGFESTRTHDQYSAYYPDGWQLIWVTKHEAKTHEELQAALQRNAERAPASAKDG